MVIGRDIFHIILYSYLLWQNMKMKFLTDIDKVNKK